MRAFQPLSQESEVRRAMRTALQGALAAQAATACGGSGAAGCRQLSSAASSPATGCADCSCSGLPSSSPPAAPPLANACSAPLAASTQQQACLSFCHAVVSLLFLQARTKDCYKTRACSLEATHKHEKHETMDHD